MISIIYGANGSGKSYYSVYQMVKLAAQFPTRPICTSIDVSDRLRERLGSRLVEIEKKQCRNFWEFTPPGSIVFLDEAHQWFHARDWGSGWKEKDPETGKMIDGMKKKAMDYLAEHRHHTDPVHGWSDDIYFITQRLSKLDKLIRDDANLYIWCQSWLNILKGLGFKEGSFAWSQFFFIQFSQEQDNSDRSDWKLIRGKKWVYELYDSFSLKLQSDISRAQLSLDDEDLEKGLATEQKASSWWKYAALAAVIAGLAS